MLSGVLKLFDMNYLRPILNLKHEECSAQGNRPKGNGEQDCDAF